MLVYNIWKLFFTRRKKGKHKNMCGVFFMNNMENIKQKHVLKQFSNNIKLMFSIIF